MNDRGSAAYYDQIEKAKKASPDPSALEGYERPPAPEPLPGNRRAWQAFKLVSAHREIVPMSGILGLNWGCVWPVLERMGSDDLDTYLRLRQLESVMVHFTLKEQKDRSKDSGGNQTTGHHRRRPRRR